VRLSFLEIFSTPTFCLASPFKVRTSVAVQERSVFFFLAAIVFSKFAVTPYQETIVVQYLTNTKGLRALIVERKTGFAFADRLRTKPPSTVP
jgi:hypothetical protein